MLTVPIQAMNARVFLAAFRIAGFLATLYSWLAVLEGRYSRPASLLIIFGPVLLVFAAARGARKAIDANPTRERVLWITSVLHVITMICLGISLIESIKLFQVQHGVTIPVPAGVGFVLLLLSSAFTFLTVLNLAVSGLGAPFAIALSRRLAHRSLYRWTRNPMVLGTLASLLSAGLYLQSLYFTLWVVMVFTPALLYYLKVYEERELELRFGASYLEYKAKTPFLWPGKRNTR